MGRQNSAFAVILHGSRVLLVKPRHKTRWNLPGGRLHSIETPLQGMVREVREETGLRVRSPRLAGVYPRKDGSRAYVYSARVPSGVELAGPTREIRRQRWVRIGHASRLLSRSRFRRLWDSLRRPARSGHRAGSSA